MLVASAQPLALFSREQDPSNQNAIATKTFNEYDSVTEELPPKGTAFAIVGSKLREGTLFFKMVDR